MSRWCSNQLSYAPKENLSLPSMAPPQRLAPGPARPSMAGRSRRCVCPPDKRSALTRPSYAPVAGREFYRLAPAARKPVKPCSGRVLRLARLPDLEPLAHQAGTEAAAPKGEADLPASRPRAPFQSRARHAAPCDWPRHVVARARRASRRTAPAPSPRPRVPPPATGNGALCPIEVRSDESRRAGNVRPSQQGLSRNPRNSSRCPRSRAPPPPAARSQLPPATRAAEHLVEQQAAGGRETEAPECRATGCPVRTGPRPRPDCRCRDRSAGARSNSETASRLPIEDGLRPIRVALEAHARPAESDCPARSHRAAACGGRGPCAARSALRVPMAERSGSPGPPDGARTIGAPPPFCP